MATQAGTGRRSKGLKDRAHDTGHSRQAGQQEQEQQQQHQKEQEQHQEDWQQLPSVKSSVTGSHLGLAGQVC